MELFQLINILGLTFDILGVILLFKFGLPSDLNKHGYIFKVMEQENDDEKIKWRKYKNLSNLALVIIIVGFSLQIFAITIQ